MNEEIELQIVESFTMKYYVDANGKFLGGWDSNPPDGAIEVEPSPEYADQKWLFPGWGPSSYAATSRENEWRASTLLVISRQLEAIEEDEADETPPDLLPGTRKQWLKYRGQVSNWNEGSSDFPDSTKRPVQPS